MADKKVGKELLENAYQLETPDDNVNYYGKLAESYDGDFAQGLGYALPLAVAKEYRRVARNDDDPIVDIGCGTGLLAEALDDKEIVIDGLDISDAMLAIAKTKNLYRHLYPVDLTEPLAPHLCNYGAVLSCGTFTHGHLGADAMVRLLGIGRRSALFVLTVNKEHYQKMGFQSALDSLQQNQQLCEFSSKEIDIYTGEHEHAGDKGLLLSFRKS